MTSYETDVPVEHRERAGPREQAREVFARTMELVAMTVGVAALGAWAGQDLSFGWAIGFWIAGFVSLIALSFVCGKSQTFQMTLLFAVGAFLGLAIGSTVEAYAQAFGAGVVAQAAGATALFIAGFGAWGYATRRDLAPLARIAFFALLGLTRDR